MISGDCYDEVNFDGLVGPSHNYAGLSFGNLASQKNKLNLSSPRKAALEGLEKMYKLYKMGLKQAFLPPHPRPYLPLARSLSYKGSLHSIIENIQNKDPVLLNNLYSASSMWTANAAMCTPSLDSADGKVHFTIANLSSNLHRSIEAGFSYHAFKYIFSNSDLFCIHSPLESPLFFSDEGAANHTRLCASHSKKGLELFHFGHYSYQKNASKPIKYPSRQSYESCYYISQKHQLNPNLSLFIKQNPKAIDSGVFHNDVISVGNESFLFYHELAFEDSCDAIEKIQKTCEDQLHFSPYLHCVKQSDITIEEVVKTYLFNSQILRLSDESMMLLCPSECEESEVVSKYIKQLIESDSPVQSSIYFNLRESMSNGGGPACLRLRVPLNQKEQSSLPKGILINETSYEKLKKLINKHYREKLHSNDLKDPHFANECLETLDEIAKLIEMPELYTPYL